ncbi:MAG: beta-CASP ribonuclease aCPSF1 [Candidatus Methanofastidiosia archaeon]
MSSEEILKNIKQIVDKSIPPGATITNMDFEGPEVVIYTRNPSMLVSDADLIKDLAKKLRKRVVIRPDVSIITSEEEAVKKIKQIIPDEAEITNINFDPGISEVIIESKKPGLAIGKSGSTLREITKNVRWAPRIVRTPPMTSTTVQGIRATLHREHDERKRIMRAVGHKIYRSENVRSKWIRITALGGFREVGRSCILLQTNESNILMDCGVNVASDDPSKAYPYLSCPEFKYILSANELDAIIITHAHLDHSGFVPYLYKSLYDGPVYCTPATRDLMMLLQKDFVEIAKREGKPCPYDIKEIKEEILHTIPLDYKEVRDIAPDVRLTLHNAGHILGSSIVHLHVGNGLHNIAYSGDFKFSRSRLLEPANIRFPRLETLIMESTYGGSKNIQPSREDAESDLLRIIKRTIERKGKVLIPVLAVGRAQELMLVLEEAARKGIIPSVPIYLDGMIWEATAIHTAYPEYLSKVVRDQIFHQEKNPFLSKVFDGVANSTRRKEIMEGDPAIILATSGMLIGGSSVEYFKNFAPDPRNAIIFVSYQAEGSMGSRVQKGWDEIPIRNGNGRTEVINVKMGIHTIEGFSGHSDRNQLLKFVRKVNNGTEKVFTNHGESSKCIDLASAVYKNFRIETRSPLNMETFRVY